MGIARFSRRAVDPDCAFVIAEISFRQKRKTAGYSRPLALSEMLSSCSRVLFKANRERLKGWLQIELRLDFGIDHCLTI